MQTHHRVQVRGVFGAVLVLTILALSCGPLRHETYAQGGAADVETGTTDEGGTCDGCLDEASAGAANNDALGTGDFITGIPEPDAQVGQSVPAPSAAVFSLSMIAIGTAVFFVRRWFAMPA